MSVLMTIGAIALGALAGACIVIALVASLARRAVARGLNW